MKVKWSKSLLHVYLVPVILLLGVILTIFTTSFLMQTTTDENGKVISTKWGKEYAEELLTRIEVKGDVPAISKEGIDSLINNDCWVQVLNKNGDEVCSSNKPVGVKNHYAPFELLLLYQQGFNGRLVVVNEIPDTDFVVITGCPVSVSKVMTYMDTARYQSGRIVIFGCMAGTLLLVFFIGFGYCIFISRQMNRIYQMLNQISLRTYEPVKQAGFFGAVYEGLNELDSDIEEASRLRKENEKAKNEWITNITHDLKTPLVSIKGYAEIMSDSEKVISNEKAHEYGQIMSRNTLYMEDLMKDLTLTYQLQNGGFPVNNKEQNLVRFLRELVIDILNTPDFAKRTIEFEAKTDTVKLEFDEHLLKRAITNLIVNSLVHNTEETVVSVRVESREEMVLLWIEDNGCGMEEAALEHLFDRYYRGTGTEAKPEGTGLGMAIAKQIIETNGGTISVYSSKGKGTSFQIQFSDKNLR